LASPEIKASKSEDGGTNVGVDLGGLCYGGKEVQKYPVQENYDPGRYGKNAISLSAMEAI
jgi:hypothetical protein